MAFNFGTPEFLPDRTVLLTTDVAIIGETVGSSMTTIEGGLFPFFGVTKAKTRISGIHFVSPLVSAIIMIASTGAEILRNRITNVVGDFLPFLGLSEGRGIKFLGNGDPDGAITGRVVVADNVIEDMHADLSDAIVFDAVAADVVITRNRVDTVQSSGLLLIDSAGTVTIAANHIVPGPGDPGEFSFGNGMTIVGSRDASYSITANRVVADNPSADGIFLVGDIAPIERAVVSGNHVSLGGSNFGGVTFEDNVSDSRVSRNTVDGVGATAFALAGSGFATSPVASANVLAANDVTDFAASFAHVFLDAHTEANTIVGCHGTIVDLGTGNRALACAGSGVAARASVGAEGGVRSPRTLRHTIAVSPGLWALPGIAEGVRGG